MIHDKQLAFTKYLTFLGFHEILTQFIMLLINPKSEYIQPILNKKT